MPYPVTLILQHPDRAEERVEDFIVDAVYKPGDRIEAQGITWDVDAVDVAGPQLTEWTLTCVPPDNS